MKKIATSIIALFLGANFMFVGAYSGGSGTAADPYRISNLEDLIELSNKPSDYGAYFMQTADIDAATSISINGNAGFKPIGNITNQFTGVYDGNGKAISGLVIDRPTEDNVGLFGYTNGAQLKSICMKQAKIKGANYVGGIVGNLWNGSSIQFSSFVDGAVEGNQRVGGIAGSVVPEPPTAESTKIAQSFATGSIAGSTFVGGLVGYNNGHVGQSYAMASAATINNFGGIGGLVGQNGPTGKIAGCYATGAVSGPAGYSGGLVGFNEATPGAVTESYWDTGASGIAESAGGEGRTTAAMQTQATYVGWDFAAIWQMVDCRNRNYPLLAWQDYNALPNTCTSVHPENQYPAIDIRGVEPNIYAVEVPENSLMDVYSISGKLLEKKELSKGINIIDLTGYLVPVCVVKIQGRVFKLMKNNP